VSGDLTISGEDIIDLTPLASLTSIKGSLIIQNNPKLRSIFGLNSLFEVGYVRIRDNPFLQEIDGLNALEKCGGMDIDKNQSLNTIKCFVSPGI
jgi:hypothetical protein